MKTIHHHTNLKHTFGNLLRGQHVLIVCRNLHGQLLLGHKPDFYPHGIYRFIGGGIDDGEKPVDAAVRELSEETGLIVSPAELSILYKVVTNATVGNQPHTLITYIAYYDKPIDERKIKAGDDISGLKALNPYELKQLIQNYSEFSDNDWYRDEVEYKHLWQDYGKVYGPIHQLVYDHLNY